MAGQLSFMLFDNPAQHDKSHSEASADWTTVGTPFLSYAAEAISAPLLSATAVVIAALGAVLIYFWKYLKDDPWHWMGGFAWTLPASLLALLVFVAGLLLFLSIRPIVRRAAIRFENLKNARAEHSYARCWLGLWHGSDEPINGLSSSLGKPQSIVPRFMIGRGPVAILKLPLALYNIWLARAADQFVWTRLARKVQGNDLPSCNLARVSRSPFRRHRWAELPEEISVALTKRSDAQAAITLSGSDGCWVPRIVPRRARNSCRIEDPDHFG